MPLVATVVTMCSMLPHKDKIALQKIVSEMNIAIRLLGETSLADFLEDEMLKRALVVGRDKHW